MAACDELKTLLGAYADGQLSAVETDAVAVHLQQCGRCRQIVREQQRVQHVLDSHQPPPVPAERWSEMGKRLRAELEGKGERAVLRTRSRVEALDPTPPAQPSLKADETRAQTPRLAQLPRPASRPRSTTVITSVPAVTVMSVRARRPHSRFGWVAHIAGALAASLLIAISTANMWVAPAGPPATTPAAQIALARPDEVDIIGIETTDPDYSVIVNAGDADAAAVWVVPSQG
jgi:anti-sigma factor RsiW